MTDFTSSPPRRLSSSAEGGRRLAGPEQGPVLAALARLAQALERVTSREEVALQLSHYLGTFARVRRAWLEFAADPPKEWEGWVLVGESGFRQMGHEELPESAAGYASQAAPPLTLRIAGPGGSEALFHVDFAPSEVEEVGLSPSLATALQALLGLALQRLGRVDLAEVGQVQWEKVFDASSDLFVFHAEGGRVFRANLAVSAYLNRPIASCIGATCEGLFPGLCPRHDCGDHQWTDPVSGRVFQVSTQAVGVRRATAILHVLHEVTEQLRFQELALQRDRMAFSAKLLEGVAHEIRNPLFALSTVTQALEKELGRERGLAPHLSHILEQVRRMDLLMKRFLAISFTPPPAGASFLPAMQVVNRALAMASVRCPPGWKERMAVSASDEGLMLPESGDTLPAAIVELIENALHFSSPEGRVELALRRTGHQIEVVIRDRGPGLTSEARANLFVPFFTTRPGRTGLGLAAAKAAVTRLGGSIRLLEEEPSPGAAFLLSFPSGT